MKSNPTVQMQSESIDDRIMKKQIKCPNCGTVIETYINPKPTVDIIIRYQGNIVLIERGEPPYGIALPGGYVDYGESLEEAALREAGEETGLKLENLRQFRAYSDPNRDERQHNISMIFHADGIGEPHAGSDAQSIILLATNEIMQYRFAFDHYKILSEYLTEYSLV